MKSTFRPVASFRALVQISESWWETENYKKKSFKIKKKLSLAL